MSLIKKLKFMRKVIIVSDTVLGSTREMAEVIVPDNGPDICLKLFREKDYQLK